MLTFGGAFSNHIYAVAAAGKLFGFKTIGIIRGENHLPLNHTLTFAKRCGMQLSYMNRSEYREKESALIIKKLKHHFGDFYLIPEGGTNELALRGATEMIEEINLDFDYACMPCGTAGTLAGAIMGLKKHQKAIGFSSLKGQDFLENEVIKLTGTNLDN